MIFRAISKNIEIIKPTYTHCNFITSISIFRQYLWFKYAWFSVKQVCVEKIVGLILQR